MRLIDVIRQNPRRLVMPLMGFPGIQLTHSTIWQNIFNSELQSRTMRALVDRFEPDGAFFMMDLAVEAGAIGLPVNFSLNDSPTVSAHPVRDVSDLVQFRVLNPLHDGRIRAYLDAMRRMQDWDGLTGAYVTGPFTLAGLMMGATEIAMATLDQPDLVHAAAEFSLEVVIPYARALMDAGADMICILEPTAMFLSPTAFRTFSGAYVSRLIDAIETMTLLHICGDTAHLVDAMCETGADGLSLDAPMDFPATAERIPEAVVLVGNVDPVEVMSQGTPERVRASVEALLSRMAPYPNFILSTGCDLPPETPLANIQAFMDAGRGGVG
jgi:uroporphyrinogen decarboxylase